MKIIKGKGIDKTTTIKKGLAYILDEHINKRLSKFCCCTHDIEVIPTINVVYDFTDISDGYISNFKNVILDDYGMIYNNILNMKIYAKIGEEERTRLRKMIPLEEQKDIDKQFNDCEQLMIESLATALVADLNLSKNRILFNIKSFSIQYAISSFIIGFLRMFYILFKEMIENVTNNKKS